MPRDEQSLQWSDLDFGWGIWSADEVVSGHAAAPDGAATRDTYGCWSPPAGGLAPLPGESTSVSATPIADLGLSTSDLGTATDYDRGMDRMWLADGKAFGPVMPAGSVAPSVPDGLVYLYHFVTPNYSTADRQWGVAYSRVLGYAARNFGGSHSLANFRYARIGPSMIIQAIGYDTGRFVPVAVTSLRKSEITTATTNFGGYDTWPDESNPAGAAGHSSNWNAKIGDDKYVAGIIAHQNRILALVAPVDSTYGWGADGQVIGAEEIWYNGFDTDNKPDTQSAFVGPVIVSEGEYSGFGAWASLNSNELLLIRHRGGGALIRGDIANPQIIRLTGLEGTYGMTNIAVVTPAGVAYGSRTGYHLYAGNDTTEHLSPQLAGDFWIDRAGWTGCSYGVEAEMYQQFGPVMVGRATYRSPWLFVPNNYLCDLGSERRPWWRLTVQGQQPIHHWDTGTVGIWGFHQHLDKGGTYTRAATHFDPEQPTNLYYYESLPITPSRARYINIREILVTVSGQTGDQVVVRVSGIAGTGGNTYDERTITLAASGTEDHRLDLELKGTNVQVSVTATAAGASTNPAPRVHKLSYGYVPAAKINS